MYSEIINDRFEELRKALRPMRVDVTVDTVDHCYVLFVDGRKSFTDPLEWTVSFGGFAEYVAIFLHKLGISHSGVTTIAANHVMINIGSVFDMIKNVKENE